MASAPRRCKRIFRTDRRRIFDSTRCKARCRRLRRRPPALDSRAHGGARLPDAMERTRFRPGAAFATKSRPTFDAAERRDGSRRARPLRRCPRSRRPSPDIALSGARRPCRAPPPYKDFLLVMLTMDALAARFCLAAAAKRAVEIEDIPRVPNNISAEYYHDARPRSRGWSRHGQLISMRDCLCRGRCRRAVCGERMNAR